MSGIAYIRLRKQMPIRNVVVHRNNTVHVRKIVDWATDPEWTEYA